jgi:hypothetical protein
MARTNRRDVFEPDEIGVYHCVNRCVRGAHLCGEDPTRQRNYEHRRDWVRLRLMFLVSIFAIDQLNFSILGNHLHLLLRNRPDLRDRWSDEEVVRRWWRLCPQRRDENGEPAELKPEELEALLNDHETVQEWRKRLGDISWLMKLLAENIAVRANQEERLPGQPALGRFWQGRFKSQRILDEAGLLACSLYIDLNPIRARLAETPETSWFTSAFERIHSPSQAAALAAADWPLTTADSLPYACSDEWLAPVQLDERAEPQGEALGERPEGQPSEHAPEKQPLAGPLEPTRKRASDRGYLPMSLVKYLQLLDWTGREVRADKRGSIPDDLAPILERLQIKSEKWIDLVINFGRSFATAVGLPQSLAAEAARRGRKFLRGQRSAPAAFVT